MSNKFYFSLISSVHLWLWSVYNGFGAIIKSDAVPTPGVINTGKSHLSQLFLNMDKPDHLTFQIISFHSLLR